MQRHLPNVILAFVLGGQVAVSSLALSVEPTASGALTRHDLSRSCGIFFTLPKPWRVSVTSSPTASILCELYVSSSAVDRGFSVFVESRPYQEVLVDWGFSRVQGSWQVQGRGSSGAHEFAGPGWTGVRGEPVIGFDTGGHGTALGETFRAVIRSSGGAVLVVNTEGLWNAAVLDAFFESVRFKSRTSKK